jgi:integrase
VGELVNRNNYLLVKQHLTYLDEVRQLSDASLKRYWFYLRHLLIWADETLLSKSTSIRPAFPKYISSLPGRRGESNLSLTTQKKIINTSKRFLVWAKDTNPNKFKKLSKAWIDALHPPRIATQSNKHIYVTLEEAIKLATISVEEGDLALQRDRAAAAMLFLSGMRASAFATLPIKAVDLETKSIRQWPELGVLTKNGKRATTYLLPIPELLDVVKEWDALLRQLLNLNARWYIPIKNCWGEQSFSKENPGKNRSQALSKRLRIVFSKAGLPYKSPHKFRHGHTVFGLQHAEKMADYKAVSMNIMHNNIKTTDEIYAPILNEEVGYRISNLSDQPTHEVSDIFEKDLQNLTNEQISRILIDLGNKLANR